MRLKAVVLAAGAGRRFGGSKLTAPLRGRPLLTHALDAALAAPVEELLLVTGFHAKAVVATVSRHAGDALAAGRLRLIHAADAAEGLAASLRAGVTAAGTVEGVFVFLADMPDIPAGLADRLAAELRAGIDAVAPRFEGSRGHPVLLSSLLAAKLREGRGDRGAAALLASPGVRLAMVEVDDPGILRDVDTPDDLLQKS